MARAAFSPTCSGRSFLTLLLVSLTFLQVNDTQCCFAHNLMDMEEMCADGNLRAKSVLPGIPCGSLQVSGMRRIFGRTAEQLFAPCFNQCISSSHLIVIFFVKKFWIDVGF